MGELGTAERRQAIWEYLCCVWFKNAKNLAIRFGVCERTMQNDLVSLSCSYPIETSFGPYGGIRVASWFHPDRKFLSSEQTTLLLKLRVTLEDEERKVMNSILIQFALPGSF